MRLPKPFYRLPVDCDVAALQAQVAALPDRAWVPHPDGVAGNSAVRLISVDGGENDGHHGAMRPTPWLEAMPYLRRVLAGLGVVWSRSRLMRLDPGVGVPEHADIHHHWHTRVRVHIPVFTNPAVRFWCDGQAVHMAAGEVWIFDNWRRHRVDNAGAAPRIHLVADTSGTAEFWRLATAPLPPRGQWQTVAPTGPAGPPLLTEADQRRVIMPPAEVHWLIDDLCAQLAPAPGLAGAEDAALAQARARHLAAMLADFVRDWRQLAALHGLDGQGAERFAALAAAMARAAQPLCAGLVMQGNGVPAALVLHKRVLQALIAAP